MNQTNQTNHTLSDEILKIAKNYENEYEYVIIDAMSTECRRHEGLHWLIVNDLANQLWGAMNDVGEVESGSMIDELMAAVVLLATDQALKRAAKVLGVPLKELHDKENELSDQEGF
jgi:hypothetical protein